MGKLRVDQNHLKKVMEARSKLERGQYGEDAIAIELKMARQTVHRFFTREPIEDRAFILLCQHLRLAWQEVCEQPVQVLEPIKGPEALLKVRSEGFVNPMLSSPHTRIFATLMERKLQRYVGRTYVIDTFEQFTQQHDRGYFILMGEPGEGKSTIAARYAQSEDCLFYFNVRGDGQNTAALFLENICWQLIERYKLEKPAILPPSAVQNNVFLRTLLSQASAKGNKVVIVVDALDEVDLDAQSGLDSNVLFLPKYLPTGVYFLLTSRRYVEKLDGRLLFDTAWESIMLEDFAESTADIEQYIRNFLNDPQYRDPLAAWMRQQRQSEAEFIETLREKSVRNFLYISLVLPEIANPQGIYRDALLSQLPKGLTAHYDRHWILMGMNRQPYQVDKLMIICVICQELHAVSCQRIAEQAGDHPAKVQLILNQWMQFLEKFEKNQTTRYKFYHESYRDFVFSKPEVQASCGSPQDVDELILNNTVPDDVVF